jgi:hypothetical protein
MAIQQIRNAGFVNTSAFLAKVGGTINCHTSSNFRIGAMWQFGVYRQN